MVFQLVSFSNLNNLLYNVFIQVSRNTILLFNFVHKQSYSLCSIDFMREFSNYHIFNYYLWIYIVCLVKYKKYIFEKLTI